MHKREKIVDTQALREGRLELQERQVRWFCGNLARETRDSNGM